MSRDPLRVLLVEDNPDDAWLALRSLERAGFAPEAIRVEVEADYLAHLSPDLDVILCDYRLPRFDALRALQLWRERAPDVPFLLVSDAIGEVATVNILKQGATDYLLKSALPRLGPAVRQAMKERQLREGERSAQVALQASEEQYRVLAESIPHMVWTARADGQLVYVNQRIIDYTGLQVPELAGRAWKLLAHPDDLPLALGVWQSAGRTGAPHEFEVRIRRADGGYRWFLVRQVAVCDGAGTVTRWFGTCTDIHDQKIHAERLARQAMLLASVRDSIVVTDLQGYVTYWNEGATRLFGWTAEEMLGRHYGVQFADAEREHITDHIQERVAGEEWAGEYLRRRKDGSEVWIQARVGRICDDRGAPIGVLGLAYDISDRKQAERALRESEEQLRRAQKMEAIGRLAGGVAHDFNNILSVILSFTELLQEEFPAGDARRQDLQEITVAASRAAALTRQLLMFSRQHTATPCHFDVNATLSSMERMIQRFLGREVSFTLVPAPTEARILADPGQIEQVILNLVVNARDAMPDGGKLDIVCAIVEGPAPGDGTTGRRVVITVSDTGEGMDAATRARIFEPFYTTRPVGKGTGLGLSTAFGIVQQSGGEIAVTSQPGVGSTFRIYLPEVDGVPMPAATPAPAAGPGGEETILLVEDDAQLRVVARHLLHRAGYVVLEARNAGEALLISETHPAPVHLLLSDVAMPYMSGPQLARRLGRSRPGMKVLCMSGPGEEAVGRQDDDVPMAFLQKPFTPELLAKRVRETLDGAG